jgi:hypothetical protein
MMKAREISQEGGICVACCEAYFLTQKEAAAKR